MSRLYKAVFLGFLIGIVGGAISFFRFAHDIEENAGLGLLFELRGVRKAPADVVVVSIDRESSEYLNLSDNPDKWPRSLHTRLVEKLAREGAQVIIFDLYFTEASSVKEDNSFAEAINAARNVVLAEPLRTKEVSSFDIRGSYTGEHRIVKVVKPIPSLSQSAIATAPFVLPRMPVKVNQYWTFQTGAGDSPTFPVVAFQLYALPVYDDLIRLLDRVRPNQAGRLPRDAGTVIDKRVVVRLIREIRQIFESDPLIRKEIIKELEHSDLVTRDQNKYRLLKSLLEMYGGANAQYLNYFGPPRTLSTIPFYQALRLGEESDSEKEIDVKGKAVFVGLSEILLTERRDSFLTVFSQSNGVSISGIEIAATAFANLLEDMPVKPISSQNYLLMILGWGILVGIVCLMVPTLVAAVGLAGLSVLYLVVAEYQFKANGIWYPVVVPLLAQTPLGFFGAVLWSSFETNKERKNIRKALGYYVPDEVVQQLARNIIDVKKGGQTEYGACLFTDAAEYTHLSENMGPKELNDFMHKYFEATFEPVKQNGGLVVDLKGDSILAIWKAARPDAAVRKQACNAALDVVKAVSQFNKSLETLKLPTRVAVHAGQIFLGNLGAADHYEYGAAGDTVNTASRMDGLNKYLGTQILVSEEAIQDLDGFLTREVGSFRLKGKAQPVVVHELLCRLEESEEKQKVACAVFSEALRAFRQRSWDEAKEKFHEFIKNAGGDGPSSFYLKFCEQYKNYPPEGPWKGVIPMEDK